jgi:hypothetical protein
MIKSQLNYYLTDSDPVSEQYTKEITVRFIEAINAEHRVSISHTATICASKQELVAKVSALMGGAVRTVMSDHHCAIYTAHVLVDIEYGNLSNTFDRQPTISQRVMFTVWGAATESWPIFHQIVEVFPFTPPQFEPIITWDLRVDGHHQTRNVKIAPPRPIKPAFYPWLKKDAYDVFDEYMSGNENVMLLLGETGTGKTSFIRSLIWHQKINCRLTYDERLLENDALFFAFLNDDSTSLMVNPIAGNANCQCSCQRPRAWRGKSGFGRGRCKFPESVFYAENYWVPRELHLENRTGGRFQTGGNVAPLCGNGRRLAKFLANARSTLLA